MRVLVYPEKQWAEFGAVRWSCDWEEVKPAADRRVKEAEKRGELDDIDPDRDINYMHEYFSSQAAALIFARDTVDSYRTAYGSVRVQKQVVDWFVEEDRVAEWSDVGEPTIVD